MAYIGYLHCSRLKRCFASVLLNLFIFSFLIASSGAAINDASLYIAYTNDRHGYIEPVKTGDENDSVIGGMAWEATLLKELRKKAFYDRAPFFLVDCGDMFQGTPVVNETQGACMIDLFNALKYSFVTFGNHEFDYGKDILAQRMQDSTFSWISTTVTAKELEPYYLPYVTYTFKGVKIAFLGTTTVTTPSITFSDNVENVEFHNPYAVLSSVSERLKKIHGVNTVILLSHLGLGTDQKLAERVDGIDVIFGGHTHSKLAEPLKVNKTWIMQADSSSRYIGFARIDFNGDGSVRNVSSELLEADHEKYDPDPQVLALVENYTRELNEKLSAVIGKTSEPLERGFSGGDSPMGVICADSYREATGAEIGIINVGGVRANLPAGNVTRRDALVISPFSNTIVKMKMKGSQIRSMLESSVSGIWMDIPADKRAKWKEEGKGDIKGMVPGKRSIGYVVGAGLNYVYDCSLAPGKRLLSIKINGEPLEDSRFYSVATNSFLAFGGEGFSEFTQSQDVYDTGIVDAQALENYFKAHEDISAPLEPSANNVTIVRVR